MVARGLLLTPYVPSANILPTNASWPRSATNWPATPASPLNAVGNEGF